MIKEEQVNALEEHLKELYFAKKGELLFHGWHHIFFVQKKAVVFAQANGADKLLVRTAALVHDLNYLAEKNSSASKGKGLREGILSELGFDKEDIDVVEQIILEAHTADRGATVSKEVAALSDADTLFKAIPLVPVLFASNYLQQNKTSIEELADKIVSEQQPLMEQDIYFYTAQAKKQYSLWAKTNVQLWINIQESLNDKDVQEMLRIAKELDVL